jgi:hypothetical protein
MTIESFREHKGGDFFHESNRVHEHRGVVSFLRFAESFTQTSLFDGLAFAFTADLWDLEPAPANAAVVLAEARLDWHVRSQEVLIEGAERLLPVSGYQALLRPDQQQPMSVVTTAYRVA